MTNVVVGVVPSTDGGSAGETVRLRHSDEQRREGPLRHNSRCRMIDGLLQARLYTKAKAERWRVDRDAFSRALEASAAKSFSSGAPEHAELERHLVSLHLEDLALACACADGDDEAWRHFVLTYRPPLYRAADAIDPSGGARDLVDSLYADLFGLGSTTRERRSLFRYFHGRSSLATWLRAVLSQRHVDRLREGKRTEPIPDDESPQALAAQPATQDPERGRFVGLMQAALAAVLAVLSSKDRLRMACYYSQQMTLAQVGRLLGEHEATVSRQLSKTRAAVRAGVEQRLRTEHGLGEAEVAECFASLAADAGPLDLGELLATTESGPSGGETGRTEARKISGLNRSNEGRLS